MPAWIVSLFFFLTISIDVYCPKLIIYYPLNSSAQVVGHENSVQLMFAAIAERPELQGWALKAPSSFGARQLMVNHFVFCFANWRCVRQTLNQAVSGTRRPNIIWRV